ncbi:MAG: prefoldin subunit alpha [Nanoarchaeota archaeon]
MDEKQQEILFKLSMSEQHIQQLQQQLQAVEESIIELSSLNFGLDEIKGSTGKEIRAPLGRGIFIEAKLLSDELIVDVGNKNLVKKSIPETQKIIKEQTEKLDEVKKELEEKIEEINIELTNIIMEAQSQEGN